MYTPCELCLASLLMSQVYQWLSVVLSPYHCPLAAHCLLQSSHLSLAHLATTMLGKKIHKYSHQDSKHPFYDVLITLQDSSVVCPDSSEPLVLARAVLCPPRSPPPLSFTLSLLSSLPDGCQFTALCLAPSTGCQVYTCMTCSDMRYILHMYIRRRIRSTCCCVLWVRTESPYSLRL